MIRLVVALSLGLAWSISSHALLMSGKDASLMDRSDVSSKSPQQNSAYQKGLEALARNDLVGAERAFLQAGKDNPKSATPLLGLAEVAFKRNNLTAAGKFIEQAATQEPGNFRVQSSLGRYLVLTKQYAKAETALVKAASLSTNSASPQIDLGDFYATFLNKPREAASAYASAIKLDPTHAGAHYALGNTLGFLGESQKAIEHLTKSAQLAPGNPLPLVALGRIHAQSNKPDDALKAANQALSIQPELFSARELKADALTAKGDRASALKEYEALLRKNPKNAEIHLKVGMLYQVTGRAREAVAAYKSAIAANPRMALAYNNLAWLAAERKQDLVQAETWARRAVELAPNSAQFHDTLGWVYRAREKKREALDILEKAQKLNPNDASINNHLGIVLVEFGNTSRAIEVFRKTISLSPNSPEAAVAKGMLTKLK